MCYLVVITGDKTAWILSECHNLIRDSWGAEGVAMNCYPTPETTF